MGLHISLFGQTFNMGAPGSRTVTGCALTIYDNGGLAGNYGNNRNDTMTILSGNPTTPSIRITIQEGDIANDDSLFIYNSNTCDPTKIVFMGPLNAPFFNNSNMIILGDWFTNSTANNLSGAITLRFKSNDVNSATGFKINVSCQTTCQKIVVQLDTLATIPIPHRLVPDDGYQYLDVCENQEVHIVGNASFLENDIIYHQSLDSCVFFWKLGILPEISTPMGVNSINHTFLPINGYSGSFYLKDQKQCVNFNSVAFRIRASSNPIGHISTLDSICVGTPLEITIGYNDTSDIELIPVQNNEFLYNGTNNLFDNAMYIPDGPNCPGMIDCYNSSQNIFISDPNTIVTSASDILSICLKMEHSYLGDLLIKIYCPSGQSITVHSQPNGAGLYMGLPIDNSGSCDANSALMGVGWNYCWSENTGYSYHAPAPSFIHQGQTGPSCDSTNRQNNTNYYKPMSAFAGLIGCPLNGTWSLEVCDLYGIDDGWIFQWQLNFDTSLITAPWTYNVGINQILWSGSTVSAVNDSSVIVTPTQSGLNSAYFLITDEFGCYYDSLISFNVVQSPNSDFTYLVVDSTNVFFSSEFSDAESYFWDFGNGETSTQQYPVYDFLIPGEYSVSLTTSNGHCNNTTTQTISVSNTGINEQNKEFLKVFPIPSTGKITIQLETVINDNTTLQVFDLTGKSVFQKSLTALESNKHVELDLSHLGTGVYQLQMKNDQIILNRIIVIKR